MKTCCPKLTQVLNATPIVGDSEAVKMTRLIEEAGKFRAIQGICAICQPHSHDDMPPCDCDSCVCK